MNTPSATAQTPSSPSETVLILTPVKNAVHHLESYWKAAERLTYPASLLSFGFIESDSTDGTFEELSKQLDRARARFAGVGIWQKHFNFQIPDGVPRWAPAFQIPRRKNLAKARNHLLFHALEDHDWVLWLDVDVVEYPPELLQTLIGTGREIVHPHCVREYGMDTFDLNAWREHGQVHMDALRGGADLVRLDSVGGTVLLVRADLHRDGLIFPPFFYGGENPAIRRPHPLGPHVCGELETEGLGIMAIDMGCQCWGMPNLEVLHAKS
jgi:peptide chain release factor subunit 1